MGGACSIPGSGDTGTHDHVISLKSFDVHRVVGKGGFGKVNAVIRKGKKPVQWYAIKTLSKAVVIQKKSAQMIWNERNLLTLVQSPFVVSMYMCFQDSQNCYMVMDLMLGGDLRYHLSKKPANKGGFNETLVKFYTAGTVLSLEYLHSISILHRDIKPENIILDEKGYPRLTDLGVSAKTENLRYRGDSGTKSYLAPEVFAHGHEHGVAMDFFALGVTTFELLFARRPWRTDTTGRMKPENCGELIKDFPESRFKDFYPPEILESPPPTVNAQGEPSAAFRSFLRGMLHPIESKRLGFNGADEIKKHEWFAGFDWEGYKAKKIVPSFIPDTNRANCDTGIEDMKELLGEKEEIHLTPEQQALFNGYDFRTEVVPEKSVPRSAHRH